MTMPELSRVEARRIAVRAQLLGKSRPTELLDVVRHLTLLQADQTATIAPNADLVLWSRLGSAYSMADLQAALDDQTLLELMGMIRPAEDLALYRGDMQQWPGEGEVERWRLANAEWVEANQRCRQDILERLRQDGPLPVSELPDTCDVPWRSSGWNNNRSVIRLVDLLVARGEVAMAQRDGRERLWDLAERIYPDVDAVPPDEARLIRDERRLRALGIARAKATATLSEPNDVGTAGVEVRVTGLRGTWRVDPAQLDQPFHPRAALLSPLDRLVFDRKRMVDIFAFDYQLEMYKPVAARRWGYFALPILYGDRLIGKVDATAERAAGVLVLHAVHRDVEFSRAITAAVNREIADLARWLNLELVDGSPFSLEDA